MKTVSLRELHEKTGRVVRNVAEVGAIYITDRGKTVAKIVPEEPEPEVPYFARRKLTPAFRKIMEKLQGGTDSTQIISEDRDRPIE
jgi:antitoxin (DNA-binding transcriptional repressor) of toxin-antitoxin stability system